MRLRNRVYDEAVAQAFTVLWEAAIDAHTAHQSTQPKPFVWTKTAADILQNVICTRSWFDE